MFATIKSLIPEPRQVDQPRHYIGRHRQLVTAARAARAAQTPATEAEESAPAEEAGEPAVG